MKRPRFIVWSLLLFLLFTTFAHGQQAEIRILHINDFHGFAEPYMPLGSDELSGGISYLATKANQLRGALFEGMKIYVLEAPNPKHEIPNKC